MSLEWKPGDVALINGRVCIRKGEHEWEHGDERAFTFADSQTLTIRPLVVIDPEDAEQVERLVYALAKGSPNISTRFYDEVRTALREFANPTPPKPQEPTGLGAVVEDADGLLWVRVNAESHDWRCGSLTRYGWGDVAAVRVLSEGVTP